MPKKRPLRNLLPLFILFKGGIYKEKREEKARDVANNHHRCKFFVGKVADSRERERGER